jgi:hypothetical protein
MIKSHPYYLPNFGTHYTGFSDMIPLQQLLTHRCWQLSVDPDKGVVALLTCESTSHYSIFLIVLQNQSVVARQKL